MKVTKIAQEIVNKSEKIIKKYDLDKLNLILDYVDIFPKSKEEFLYYSAEIEKLGSVVYKTQTGNTYKLFKPIKTSRGDLLLLRVREFDASRIKFLGHPDYTVKDFDYVKTILIADSNVNLIDRGDYLMIEIWDNEMDVLLYIPSIPLSYDIKAVL